MTTYWVFLNKAIRSGKPKTSANQTLLGYITVHICIAEDRPSERVAVKLLLLSIAEHCPDVPVILFYPPADTDFKAWLQGLPQVELRTEPVMASRGWNIKPYILLKLLDEGYKDIWWLDSDLLMLSDIRSLGQQLSPETVAICEEALYGAYLDNGLRTTAWGLPLGRRFPFTLNTGVLRISSRHRDLLQRWCQTLEEPVYQTAQAQYWYQRPAHLVGDQDVLTALLGSQDFAAIPLHIIKRGTGVIQYFGFSAYTLRERWNNLWQGPPLFIHCQGWKPWLARARYAPGAGFRQWLQNLYIEWSPYLLAARRYQTQLGEHADWLEPSSRAGRWGRILGGYHPVWTGLPLALLFDIFRYLKKVRELVRKPG